jgi:hypothetical protein
MKLLRYDGIAVLDFTCNAYTLHLTTQSRLGRLYLTIEHFSAPCEKSPIFCRKSYKLTSSIIPALKTVSTARLYSFGFVFLDHSLLLTRAVEVAGPLPGPYPFDAQLFPFLFPHPTFSHPDRAYPQESRRISPSPNINIKHQFGNALLHLALESPPPGLT